MKKSRSISTFKLRSGQEIENFPFSFFSSPSPGYRGNFKSGKVLPGANNTVLLTPSYLASATWFGPTRY
jgi:hypothetical protein